MHNTYKVSVRLMTYNHGSFVRKAIEGILLQNTNFKVEVVIGDDFSTDDTLEVLREFENTENIHLRILERPIDGEYHKKRQQLGRLYNFQNIIENCTGQYIALLDGDDYWTDPLKLEKQVAILDNDLGLAICYHNVEILKNGKLIPDDITTKQTTRTTAADLSKGNYMHTPTVMYRNQISLPSWFVNVSAGDFALHLLNAQHGSIHHINETMAVYRIHDGGAWSLTSKIKKQCLWYKQSLLMSDYFTDTTVQNNLKNKAHSHYLRLLNGLESEPKQVLNSLQEIENDNSLVKHIAERHRETLFYFENRFKDKKAYTTHLSKTLSPQLIWAIIKKKITHRFGKK